MVNTKNTHTANRTPRQPLERPRTRPADRPNGQRPKARHIHDVLTELAQTRQLYEDLRHGAGPMDKRAQLISILHELRAEAFVARSSSSGRP
jgi:hypothetical protein